MTTQHRCAKYNSTLFTENINTLLIWNTMPAKSKAQRRLMAMALLYKRGQLESKYASDEVKELSKSISEQDLHKFATTKQTKLPKYVKGSPYRNKKKESNDK